MDALVGLELERLDRLMQREALRLRTRYELGLDELRGLYITDEQVDSLLSESSEAASILPAIDELDGEAARLDGELETRGGRLRALGRRLGLDAFERDALLLGCAPELDLKYETAIAYLNNDVARKWPTTDLALRLFANGDAAQVRGRLAAGARLFDDGLLEPVPSGTPLPSLAQSFRASPVLVAHLLGQEARGFLPGVGDAARDRCDAIALRPGLEQRLERLGAWLASHPSPPIVVLEGEQGSGRRAAAAWLCRSLRRGLLEIPAARLAADADLARRLRAHARLTGQGVYVAGWRGELPDALLAPGLWPIVLEATARDGWRAALAGRSFVSLRIADPDAAERASLWEAALRAEGLRAPRAAVEQAADRFAVRPGVIRDAARWAASRSALEGRGDEPVDAAHLLEATREQLDRTLGKLAAKVHARHRWEDLVLPPRILARVREIARAVAQRERVYNAWGFARHVGPDAGFAILFAGASGTGKTMTAGVIAAELGLDLYRIDLSGVVSKYIGETEKNLDAIFAAAQSAHAVLFFDEADALFGKRSEVRDAHDRYANIEVAYLLQKLEVHPGVVILASNIARNIDAAFLRRLQCVVDFPKPDPSQRRDLWERMLGAGPPLAADVDLPFLAEAFDATGGDIRTVALDAAFMAAGEDRPIAMADLVGAMARQLKKEGRLPAAASFKHYLPLVSKARS